MSFQDYTLRARDEAAELISELLTAGRTFTKNEDNLSIHTEEIEDGLEDIIVRLEDLRIELRDLQHGLSDYLV